MKYKMTLDERIIDIYEKKSLIQSNLIAYFNSGCITKLKEIIYNGFDKEYLLLEILELTAQLKLLYDLKYGDKK
jgi:hypothetical protein